MAVYNPRYLRAALDSVAAQTHRNSGIIVRDENAITPSATSFKRSKCDVTCPLTISELPSNWACANIYERCFADADGEYIKFLNDDDLLDPVCIHRLVAALQENPSTQLATSHRRRIDDRGSPLRDSPASETRGNDRFVNRRHQFDQRASATRLGLNFVCEP